MRKRAAALHRGAVEWGNLRSTHLEELSPTLDKDELFYFNSRIRSARNCRSGSRWVIDRAFS